MNNKVYYGENKNYKFDYNDGIEVFEHHSLFIKIMMQSYHNIFK